MQSLDQDWIWFIPKKKSLCITIPNPNTININPAFAKTLPERVAIGIKGLDTICIRQDEAGFRVPKRGSIKGKDVVAALIDMGLHLPARYAVTPEDSRWIGVLEGKPRPIAIDPSKASKKPRRRGLGRLIDEEGNK